MKTKSEAGFSIVETLVGVSLVGISFLALTQVASYSFSMFRQTQRAVTYNSLVTTLHSWIANEQSCRLALGGPLVYGNGPTQQTQTFDPNAPTAVKLFKPESLNTRTVFLDPSSSANTYGGIRVESIVLQSIGTPVADGTFPVSMLLQMTDATGRKRNSQELRLSVRTDSSWRIVSCGPPSFGNDSPVPLCGDDEALFSEGTFVECQPIRCPPGKTLQIKTNRGKSKKNKGVRYRCR